MCPPHLAHERFTRSRPARRNIISTAAYDSSRRARRAPAQARERRARTAREREPVAVATAARRRASSCASRWSGRARAARNTRRDPRSARPARGRAARPSRARRGDTRVQRPDERASNARLPRTLTAPSQKPAARKPKRAENAASNASARTRNAARGFAARRRAVSRTSHVRVLERGEHGALERARAVGARVAREAHASNSWKWLELRSFRSRRRRGACEREQNHTCERAEGAGTHRSSVTRNRSLPLRRGLSCYLPPVPNHRPTEFC